MKIAFIGIDFDEGKVKYNDKRLKELSDKVEPAKVSPFYVEFLESDLVSADAVLCNEDNLLELFLPDMEKLENRLSRTEDPAEKTALEKSLRFIEEEKLLSEQDFSEAEREFLKLLAPVTIKPVITVNSNNIDSDKIIEEALKKTKTVFFYTAGKKEVHAWPVRAGSDIVSCASKIHTDLARGFIRADVVSYEDYMNCHNLNDAKSKGLAKLVDRDYIINDGDIIEIRYNV